MEAVQEEEFPVLADEDLVFCTIQMCSTMVTVWLVLWVLCLYVWSVGMLWLNAYVY